ncbi:MAG: hypothetical protein L6R40_002007 [Gallowayella cf. fulva]|nr:MAG: hypothetical protein L6R40_002007 [Xanthomendoza cf. fulva]
MTLMLLSPLITLSLLVSVSFISASYVPRTPSPRAANKDIWTLAEERGERLYTELQSGCHPDVYKPITREELAAIGFHGVKDTDFTPWRDHTEYYDEYSPYIGLITAIRNRKADVETVPWPDVTFAMWEAVTAYKKSDTKHLHYIAHKSVTDVVTSLIISGIMGNKPVANRDPPKYFGPGTRTFLALLGTPNGAESVKLLMDHKRQLGFKTITKVVVFGRTEGGDRDLGPDLVLELRDMEPPGLGTGAAGNATDSIRSVCRSLKVSKDG